MPEPRFIQLPKVPQTFDERSTRNLLQAVRQNLQQIIEKGIGEAQFRATYASTIGAEETDFDAIYDAIRDSIFTDPSFVDLETRLGAAEQAIAGIVGGEESYTASNVVVDRDFDADVATIGEVADVLGTLIADLKSKGVIK